MRKGKEIEIGDKFGKLIAEGFVTKKYQQYNRIFVSCKCECGGTNSRILNAFGDKKTLAEWTKDSRCKVPYTTLPRAKNWQNRRSR